MTEVFKRLAGQKDSRIEEGHLRPDHVHITISILPKYAVLQEVRFTKGKSAIHVARVYEECKRNFVGQSFRERGLVVSTVDRNEAAIRDYIRDQEEQDKHLVQLKLWHRPATGTVA